MALNIDLPPDVTAKYAAEARNRGLSLERHLRERLIQQAPASEPEEAARRQHRLNLPAKKGTVIGSLSRRDIYAERG